MTFTSFDNYFTLIHLISRCPNSVSLIINSSKTSSQIFFVLKFKIEGRACIKLLGGPDVFYFNSGTETDSWLAVLTNAIKEAKENAPPSPSLSSPTSPRSRGNILLLFFFFFPKQKHKQQKQNKH